MKNGAARILARIDELTDASWLGRQGREWPGRLFHLTDASNAAKIIESGRIYSRQRADGLGVEYHDAADREVIAMSRRAHGYARFYFAPRTPTQYWMEGIRPVKERRHGAHCPIPVFFVLDARRLLVRSDCYFTAGNLGSPSTAILSAADDFCTLPFREIYHRGAFPQERRSEIIYARNAEVLFEGELDLAALVEIVCRTGPEREMLLYRLGRERARKWKSRIRLERSGEGLFERSWYYVRDVKLIDGETIYVSLSRPCGHARTLFVRYEDGRSYRYDIAAGERPATQDRFALPEKADRVQVAYRLLDDTVAFHGVLTQRELF